MKNFLRLLHREVNGIHEAAYLLGFFALLSQLLGLIRDRLLAHTFGASETLDIYYAAFRVPDFIFVTIASLVSVSVLIPLLVPHLEKGGEEARRFMSQIFSVFFLCIILASIVAFVAMPYLLPVLFAAYKGTADMGTLIMLSRILLLSPFFLGLSNLFGSITQASNRFFLYAISPLLYNCGIIIGILFFLPRWGLSGLVWGVVLGALLHFLIQIPYVVERGLFPRFTRVIQTRDVKTVVFLSLPRTITMSAQELSKLVLISLASLLVGGSISIFTLAHNLQSVPLSVIGVSYSLAVFPTMARLFSKGDTKQFLEKMIVSVRHVIFLSLPVMMLIIVLRAHIVRTILGSGNFNWEDTRLTAAALAIFSLSLIPQTLVVLFVRAYYSSGRTRKPLLINIISSAVTIVLGFVFLKLFFTMPSLLNGIERVFKVQDIPGSVVLALPLAFSVGVWLNAIIHWWYFEKEFPGFSRAIRRTAWQSFSSSVVMAIVAYGMLSMLGLYFPVNTFIGIFMHGFIAGVVGIFIGSIILFFYKSTELHDLMATFRKKIWKTPVIGPDPS